MKALKERAERDQRNDQPTGANPADILALLERIEQLEYQLGRYSMSAGHADQRRAESRACREALGFDPESEHVSPSDLRGAINKLASEPDLRPGLTWAIERCKALQSQGFERSRNDVLIRDFQNCIGSLTKLPE
ncbi:hypothetical protein [Halomonas getboli]|uniref:hypothetical protein n=1 Tax=Halomonas getboli TaxID=2935862 RepID=UPI001FFFCACB|nr:hypothetical protein [Halomonas getboli]MCK2185705.1 hypothetical protein [Halomonas getboli]